MSGGQRPDGPGWGEREGRSSAGAGRLDPDQEGEEGDEVTTLGSGPRPGACLPPAVLLGPHPIPGVLSPLSAVPTPVGWTPLQPPPWSLRPGWPSLRPGKRARASLPGGREGRSGLIPPGAQEGRRRPRSHSTRLHFQGPGTSLQASLRPSALHSRAEDPGSPGFRPRLASDPRAELKRVSPKRGRVCPVDRAPRGVGRVRSEAQPKGPAGGGRAALTDSASRRRPLSEQRKARAGRRARSPGAAVPGWERPAGSGSGSGSESGGHMTATRTKLGLAPSRPAPGREAETQTVRKERKAQRAPRRGASPPRRPAPAPPLLLPPPRLSSCPLLRSYLPLFRPHSFASPPPLAPRRP